LEKNGYTVVIMAWDFRPGGLFSVEMDEAIRNCMRMIVVLSKAYPASYFSKEEWVNFLAKKECCNIIPVCVEDFKSKGIWAARIYIDVVNKNEQEATSALLAGVSKKGVSRTGSGFPGHGCGSSQIFQLPKAGPYLPNWFRISSPSQCKSLRIPRRKRSSISTFSLDTDIMNLPTIPKHWNGIKKP
jgi:hypothetical protein